MRTLIVEVSGTLKNRNVTAEKANTTRDLWLPAINAHGGFGRWGYAELTDPKTFRVGLARPSKRCTWNPPSSPVKELRANATTEEAADRAGARSRRSGTRTSVSTSPRPTPVS